MAKLSDAAIAIDRVLTQLGVEFAIFGGYAVAALGGPRESKNIDCVVNCSKDWLIANVGPRDGFSWTGNGRNDLAALLYGDHTVLIEFFPTSMSTMRTGEVGVTGERNGYRRTIILDPVFIFKGKLQAAATRAKHSDAVDLLFLEGRHNQELRARNNELHRRLVGMALKRYPHWEYCFGRLGVNLVAAKAVAQNVNVDAVALYPSVPNSVQNGLLFNLRAADV